MSPDPTQLSNTSQNSLPKNRELVINRGRSASAAPTHFISPNNRRQRDFALEAIQN